AGRSPGAARGATGPRCESQGVKARVRRAPRRAAHFSAISARSTGMPRPEPGPERRRDAGALAAIARGARADRAELAYLRELADRMFSRAAGAPLIGGNQVRLLVDGPENYAAWLEAIHGA